MGVLWKCRQAFMQSESTAVDFGAGVGVTSAKFRRILAFKFSGITANPSLCFGPLKS